MRLLITGAWNASAEQLDQIRALGHEVIWHQQEREALPVDYGSIQGVICNGLFLSHPIENFTALRYIQLTSAGYDRVPMEYITQKGIALFNARGVYSTPMAEFAISGVLQLYKQAGFFRSCQVQSHWEKRRDLLELEGKQVCILGCGSVGTACAKRFRAFECTVTGIDPFPREDRDYDRMLHLDQLDAVLPEADIVVLTLPLNESTRHILDRSRLALMKPGAVLVNIARGAVVDTEALLWALEHRLGGAVLDVFEEEPLGEDSPLWRLDNVILSPHCSFVGDGNARRLFRVILENLEKFG